MMQSSYLGLVLVMTCLIGVIAGQGILSVLDESQVMDDNAAVPQQIFKVPERQCPDGQERLNGKCRTVFTNKQIPPGRGKKS